MAESADKDEDKTFDVFELIVAIILGLGAIGGAWASYQSALWGGNQATAYAEASNMMTEASAIVTEASTQSNEATMTANRDADIDLQAKRHLFETHDSPDVEVVKKARTLAKWLYSEQMSDDGRQFLGIAGKDDIEDISDEELGAVLEKPLGEPYFDSLYAPSIAEYDRAEQKVLEAKRKFLEGQAANYNGDLLELTGVLYTLVMFLAGLALVFKTKVRWAFGGLSVLALVGSTVYLVKNPWTKLEAPDLTDPAVLASASAAVEAPAPPASGAPASSVKPATK